MSREVLRDSRGLIDSFIWQDLMQSILLHLQDLTLALPLMAVHDFERWPDVGVEPRVTMSWGGHGTRISGAYWEGKTKSHTSSDIAKS